MLKKLGRDHATDERMMEEREILTLFCSLDLPFSDVLNFSVGSETTITLDVSNNSLRVSKVSFIYVRPGSSYSCLPVASIRCAGQNQDLRCFLVGGGDPTSLIRDNTSTTSATTISPSSFPNSSCLIKLFFFCEAYQSLQSAAESAGRLAGTCITPRNRRDLTTPNVKRK